MSGRCLHLICTLVTLFALPQALKWSSADDGFTIIQDSWHSAPDTGSTFIPRGNLKYVNDEDADNSNDGETYEEELLSPNAIQQLPGAVAVTANASGAGDPAPFQLEYVFRAFGRPFHLVVQRDDSFMAANLAVRHTSGNSTWLEHVQPAKRHCFYAGRSAGDDGSRVALNVCNGLSGHISDAEATYFLSPLKSSTSNTASANSASLPQDYPSTSSTTSSNSTTTSPFPVHLIKRQLRSKSTTHCAVQDADYKRVSESPNFLDTSSYAPHTRRKRSYSHDLHIEVMVTADSSMKSYHGSGLHDYILTLMSIVAQIFRDPSIGNSVTVAVVKIVVTEENEDRDFVSTSAPKTLRSFCKWQSLQNYQDDSYYLHYDVAILLTRVDICRAPKKCDTLGLADLGTMCDEFNSCAIVEDNGLSAAFTIAHELGHVLNLPHDDDVRCLNFSGYGGTTLNVMARFLDTNTNPWTWSVCSSHYFTEFVDTDTAKCLRDKPTTNRLSWKMFKGDLPGQTFTADHQCEYLYGSGSKICPYMPSCNRLWCLMSDSKGCRTHHMPWADGTPCADDSICYRGQCRTRDTIVLKVVDGQWGAWTEFGECSRSCGGGIQRSTRHCNKPKPANGGKYCIGERIKYQSCNTFDCPSGTVGFREQQCSHFDTYQFNIPGLPQNIRWVPKYAGIAMNSRCKLHCRVSTATDYFVLRDKVVDGTPCGMETYDICVNGQCMPAGCDHKLFSKMKVDNCGECGGKNLNCRTVTGQFNESHYGYSRVVLIPAGSVNVDIKQFGYQRIKEDDNYLALRSDKNEYILNGEFTVTTSKKRIEYGDAVLEYTGSNVITERINSSRPLKKDLIVEVLSVGKLHPPNVRFQYSERYDRTTVVKHSWNLEDRWSNCSRICQGQQSRRPVCLHKISARLVSDERCRRLPKPSELTRSCNDHCVVRWEIVHQSECQVDGPIQCGDGVLEQKSACQQQPEEGNPLLVETEHCKAASEEKPPGTIKCYKKCPDATWEYTMWSQCSRSCNGGSQTREVKCRHHNGEIISDDHCVKEDKQLTMRSCAQIECPKWHTGNWTECSPKCGGVRLRPLWCQIGEHNVTYTLCNDSSAPPSQEKCADDGCYVSWHNGSWSQCSASCGEGIARRLVACLSEDGHMTEEDRCSGSPRPPITMPCIAPLPCGGSKNEGSVADGSHTNSVAPKTSSKSSPSSKSSAIAEADKDTDTTMTNVIMDDVIPIASPPTWRSGPWSLCNTRCGPGIQHRQVRCVTDEDTSRPERECLLGDKPLDVRECIQKECIAHNTWRLGTWSSCSVTCGSGIKQRQVICVDQFQTATSMENCPLPEPTNIQECHLALCSTWFFVDNWSKCSQPCGGGSQWRVAVCHFDNQQVESEMCQPVEEDSKGNRQPIKPPVEQRACNMGVCPKRVKWRASSWSQCSKGCLQHRQVHCLDRFNKTITSDFCIKSKKPKSSRRCRRCDVPFTWVRGQWSECSTTCGPGYRTRNVACHRVNRFNWRYPDPEPNDAACNVTDRPTAVIQCNMGNCDSHYRWTVSAWPPCPVTCGRGDIKRRIHCRDKDGNEVSKRNCLAGFKPIRKQRCKPRPCVAFNCSEVQKWQNIRQDGEHEIWIRGTKVRVHCADMATSEPKEYLTLSSAHRPDESDSSRRKAGTTSRGTAVLAKSKRPIREEDRENFSEFYGKRLKNPDSCPADGRRMETCDCIDAGPMAGLTIFYKVRLNVTSLRVITNDFRFTRQMRGKAIPFGEAGDCYSKRKCPQGRFSIDLSGTGFVVPESTKWISHGRVNETVRQITGSVNRQRINGQCGGYCGLCMPDPRNGLLLDVDQAT